LGLTVESADRFQRVAEKVEPDRLFGGGGEHIDHPATDSELAALGNRRGALIAIDREIALEVADVDIGPRARRIAGAGDDAPRRQPLKQGCSRGDQQGGLLGVDAAGKPRQYGHAMSGDPGRRTGAVIRQAIPGRQVQNLEFGREEAHRIGERRRARTIPRHEDAETASRACNIRHHQGVETLRRPGKFDRSWRGGDLAYVQRL
jgi:hypothetical protein